MNYGMMKHADERGVINLRKKLKEKIRRDISKADGSGSTTKFITQAILSYVKDLEDIAYKKGSNYYRYQKEKEDERF